MEKETAILYILLAGKMEGRRVEWGWEDRWKGILEGGR